MDTPVIRLECSIDSLGFGLFCFSFLYMICMFYVYIFLFMYYIFLLNIYIFLFIYYVFIFKKYIVYI